MSLQEWEERHRQGQDETPEPLVMSIAVSLPAGKALDLACGPGRNALWLAGHGWDVTAVDGSAAGIESLLERAAARGFPVNAVVADLEQHQYKIEPSAWDLIVMTRYHQRDLFEPVKQGVVPGGVVIASVLLTGRYGAKPGELAAYFEGWEILHQREDQREKNLAEIAARRTR